MTQTLDLVREWMTSKVEAPRARMVTGATFALDEPPQSIPILGRPDEVVWPSGEPLLVAGPTGVGHTTLMQRLMLARVGIGPADLLGFPVQVSERPALYIAADRPAQAARSLRRMVSEQDRSDLSGRVMVWKGPLHFDVAREPERLTWLALEYGVGTVFLDALKDLATRLIDDDTGQGIARAWNHLLAEGIEVVTAHHQRKGTADNREPRSIDDVYGSRWITAAAGSVLLLWGHPGDPVVELRQLKQAAGEVGPLQVQIDFDTGEMSVLAGTDLLTALRAAPKGLTAKDVASLLFGSNPSRAEQERARRALDREVRRGTAHKREGSDGRDGSGQLRREPTTYFAVERVGGRR